MARKKLSSAERRILILDAAKSVFAARGYEAATVQEIAKAGKISEALIYRHFPTKLSLYRSVLRQFIRQQDANFENIGLREANTEGLLNTILVYMQASLTTNDSKQVESIRILFASLAGDGKYAHLIYRRALRLMAQPLERALQQAEADGDLFGKPFPADNASLFIDHIGSMISAYRLTAGTTPTHSGSDRELLYQVVQFCARGLGIKDEKTIEFLERNLPLAAVDNA